MAFTKELPEDVTKAIAEQVARHIEPSPSPSPSPSPGTEHFLALDENAPPENQNLNLGESFEVWRLVPNAMAELGEGVRDLHQLARRSGIWHHQIRQNMKATGFAHSKPLGADAESWALRKVFESEFAEQIDQAIDNVEGQQIPDSVEVRLLSVSFQHVDAFWFITEDEAQSQWNNRIMIIRSSSSLPEFGPLQLMSSEAFLDILARRRGGMGISFE